MLGDRMGNVINRVTIDKTNDDPYMQEVQLRGYFNETQDEVEHFHPYGFSARVRPPSQQGETQQKAEGVMVYVTGNRSHGLLIVVGDRRYRLNGLQEGEVALHDDQGHQVHLTRDGIVISAPNSKKIVTQLMSDDTLPRNGASKDSSSSDFGQSAQAGRATDASITLTKDSFTISHKQKVQYTVGSSSLTLEPSKITITSPTISNVASSRFETTGSTILGLDNPGEGGERVMTTAGPAKKTYAKTG